MSLKELHGHSGLLMEKTNIYKSSVEKFAKQTPQKIAYHFVSEDGCTSNTTYSELDSKISKLANGF